MSSFFQFVFRDDGMVLHFVRESNNMPHGCVAHALLTGQYVHHKEVKAAQGIKISANGLESAVAGTSLFVVGPEDDVEELKEEVMGDMENIFDSVDKTGEGVYVQASTLGSLEVFAAFQTASSFSPCARKLD
jgi:translation initiation factor IF-2